MLDFNQSKIMNELSDIKKQIKKNEDMAIKRLNKISDAIQNKELVCNDSDKQK